MTLGPRQQPCSKKSVQHFEAHAHTGLCVNLSTSTSTSTSTLSSHQSQTVLTLGSREIDNTSSDGLIYDASCSQHRYTRKAWHLYLLSIAKTLVTNIYLIRPVLLPTYNFFLRKGIKRSIFPIHQLIHELHPLPINHVKRGFWPLQAYCAGILGS